jgi:hypothetical protein
MRLRLAAPRLTALRLMAVVVLLGAAVSVAATEPSSGRLVQYAKDTLTVRLDKVPLADVLADIGQQSGAEIRGTLRESREVTAEFESVPLSEALSRLLGDQNFALVYGKEGRLRAVKLLGGPLEGGVSITPTQAPVATKPQADIRDLLANHPPVPVHGRLAQALGTDSATLQQLMELGLHNEDATVRAEALRTGVQTLEGEPVLRQAVIGMLNSFDDAALGSLLRGAAGENAEEVAMQVLTQSRAPEVRVKASSVLQKLRQAD